MLLCDRCGEPRDDHSATCPRCGRTCCCHWEPSPEDISEGCEEIQATWSPGIERLRGGCMGVSVEVPRIGVERCRVGTHGISATDYAH